MPAEAGRPVGVPLEPRCFPTENALYPFSLYIVARLFSPQRGGVHPPPPIKSRLAPDRLGRFDPAGGSLSVTSHKSPFTSHFILPPHFLSVTVTAAGGDLARIAIPNERSEEGALFPSYTRSKRKLTMSVNKVILVGRLGRDPETRYTSGGQAVANFSVATDESYKDRNGERQKRTEWHKIVVWGKQAEIAQQYLKKGSLVFIEGRIQSREWQDKEGQKRTSFEIVANNFRMLGGRAEGAAAAAGGGGMGSGVARGGGDEMESHAAPADDFGGGQSSGGGPEISDEDIPF